MAGTGQPQIVRVNPRNPFIDLDTDKESRIIRFRVSAKNFPGAATTSDFDIPCPAGVMVEKALMSLEQVFAGGGVGTATLSIGLTTAVATYMAATNVFTGATVGGNITVGAGAGINTFVGGNATPASPAIFRLRLTVDTTTGVLTTGKADIFLQLRAFSVRAT